MAAGRGVGRRKQTCRSCTACGVCRYRNKFKKIELRVGRGRSKRNHGRAVEFGGVAIWLAAFGAVDFASCVLRQRKVLFSGGKPPLLHVSVGERGLGAAASRFQMGCTLK